MWQGARVAVVIPAYREERLIGRTLARVPGYVDDIYVIDDASPDDTARRALSGGDPRVQLVRHSRNLGVGAAINTGYRRALDAGADVLVVMAGDDQMDPEDLPSLLDAVVQRGADYAKGCRFRHPEARRMPAMRRLGSRALSAFTRACTGLGVDDTQCGYTALSARVARQLPLHELWPRYGYPNDLLGMLAARGFSVTDVAVRPVYRDERSGLRPWHMLTISGVILRRVLRESRARRLILKLSSRPWLRGARASR